MKLSILISSSTFVLLFNIYCISYSSYPNLGLDRPPKFSLHITDENIIIINKYLITVLFIHYLKKKMSILVIHI